MSSEYMQWMRVVKKDSTFPEVVETQKDLKDVEGFDWLVLHSPYLCRYAKALAIPPEMRSVTIQALVLYSWCIVWSTSIHFVLFCFSFWHSVKSPRDWGLAICSGDLYPVSQRIGGKAAVALVISDARNTRKEHDRLPQTSWLRLPVTSFS